jgi:hypothetical protein
LHRCKRSGGKQHETKFCHDDLVPGKRFWQQGLQQGLTINEYALGRIVAAFKGGLIFISEHGKS